MQQSLPQAVVRMRTVAANLRAYAAQTDVALNRRQFEAMASKLEEAARDAQNQDAREDVSPTH